MTVILLLGLLLGVGIAAVVCVSGAKVHLAAQQAEDERWLRIAKREAKLAEKRKLH